MIISVYSVLDDLVVHVRSEDRADVGPDPTTTTRSLHYSATPVDQVRNAYDLGEVIKSALQHAEGYSGDLLDHLTG